MNTDQIKKIQTTIGVTPDGVWGPKSSEACKAYLKGFMPSVSPWPASDLRSMCAFYGEPGDESQLIAIDFPYPMFYGGKIVRQTRLHHKCAYSLLRVLRRIKDILPQYPDITDEAEDYGGCYNFRKKRGGNGYSMHAWGAAIDLDADDNTFRDPWPSKADMPLEIMVEFAREGWISGGAFFGYDAMHFQATNSP